MVVAAASGIAATLLEGGKTLNSAFKLPLNLNNIQTPYCNTTCLVTVVSTLKDLSNKIHPDIPNLRNKSNTWLCEKALLT